MQHYHIIVDNKGNFFKGIHDIEDNINCKDNNYAQHCANGNTGTIGISACGMAGFNIKTRYTKSPLTLVQIEALCKKCAELCKQYSISIDPAHVYTHMEYDSSPNGAHHGKIDIVYIPYIHLYGMTPVGDFLRNKIQWYYNKLETTNGK